jgi:23S rRNA pseudouridine2605 synthase
MRDRKDSGKSGFNNKKKSDFQRTNKKFDGDKNRFGGEDKKKPYGRSNDRQRPENKRPFGKTREGDNPDERRQYNKPFSKNRNPSDHDKTQNRRSFDNSNDRSESGQKRTFKRPFPNNRDSGRDSKPHNRRSFDSENDRSESGEKRTFKKPFSDNRGSVRDNKPHNRRSFDNEVNKEEGGDKKPFKKSYPSSRGPARVNKPHNRRSFDNLNEPNDESRKHSEGDKRRTSDSGYKKRNESGYEGRKSGFKKSSYGKGNYKEKEEKSEWPMRLNRYISQSGICARREADVLISQGLVKVNSKVVTEMGFKVNETDEVKYDGRKIYPEKKVYLLLNKPKDYITTTDDDRGRKTVMDLVAGITKERMYPVGRLDRNTTGLLLLTNDGDLAQKLTHPSFEITKIYHATLDKKPSKEDLDKLLSGVQLDDGLAFVDSIVYLDQDDKREIGVSIHSGKNRIVRRVFEAVGYEVIRLDRVLFGPFDKKKIKRGEYRMLKPREVEKLVKAKRKI